MPIYEYRCLECSEKFDELVRINNKNNVSCPGCRSNRVQKLMSAFGVSSGTQSSDHSSSSSCGHCSSKHCSTCH